jgi:hypothetical protein
MRHRRLDGHLGEVNGNGNQANSDLALAAGDRP